MNNDLRQVQRETTSYMNKEKEFLRKKFVVPWYKSIILKQTVIFILILCPIISLFIVFYSVYQKETRNTISETTLSRDQAVFDEVDSRLYDAEYRILDLFGDSDLYMVSALWGEYTIEEKVNKISSIQEKLRWFNQMEEYIVNVTIYFMKQDLKISYMVHSAVSPEEMEEVNSISQVPIFSTVEDGKIFLYIKPVNEGFTNNPLFVCKMQVKDYKFLSIIKETYQKDGAESLLIINNKIYQSNIGNMQLQDKLYTSYINRIESIEAGDGEGFDITENGERYYCSIIKSKSQNIVWVTCRSYEEVFKQLERIIRWFPLMIIICTIIIILFLLYIRQFIRQPLVILGKAFEKLKQGEFGKSVKYKGKDEFTVLYQGFNDMSNQLQENIDNLYKQKLELQKAQLKQLQAQIDPHFLYNTLFLLKARLSTKDYQGAEEISKLLGDYFMFITRNAKDYIPLKDELEHAYVYARIQNARFLNRFHFIGEECPMEYEDILVPRLILQPLIENAIKYGTENIEEGGIIKVWFKIGEDKLFVNIEESGSKASEEAINRMNDIIDKNDNAGEVTSVININRRLKLYYGNNYSLRYEKSELGGVHAILELSTKRKDDDEKKNFDS